MIEIWKDIKGYEGLYQISNLGRVKSLTRRKVDGRQLLGRIRKQDVLAGGYRYVKLCRNAIEKAYRIHRLVAKAFIPNPNNKDQVNHLNGIKSDNTVSNLEWATHQENQNHAIKNGLKPKGSKIGNAKLIESDIVEIRRLLSIGEFQQDIAAIYGVSQATIGYIKTGKTWKHV